MATIYNINLEPLSEGVRSMSECDDAIDAAKIWALDSGEEVFVVDGDEGVTVSPGGDVSDGWPSSMGMG